MYEMKNSSGEIRQMKVGHFCDKTCKLCGQYFRPDDLYSLVVIPAKYRTANKLKDNWMVHSSEWLEFIKDIKTEEEQIEKMAKHRKPNKKPFTEEEQAKIAAFKKACQDYSLYICYDKPYGLKCQKRRSSVYAEYNVYSNKITVDFRGNHGLFDSFYTGEIAAKIQNKMNEILGIKERNNYTVAGELGKVFDSVNKMMKNN